MPEDLPRLTLSDVSVIKDGSSLMKALRKSRGAKNIKPGGQPFAGITNGHYIEDGYIYKLV